MPRLRGSQAKNTDRDHFEPSATGQQAEDETGHGSIWKTRTRYLMFVGTVAFYDTLTMELLALRPTGDAEETHIRSEVRSCFSTDEKELQQATRDGRMVHCASLMDLCHLKTSELPKR